MEKLTQKLKPAQTLSVFTFPVPAVLLSLRCPSPLAELIDTPELVQGYAQSEQKTSLRLQFSHFYRQPLWTIRY